MLSWLFGKRREGPASEIEDFYRHLPKLPHADFIRIVETLVCDLEPGGVAMLVVGYKNIIPVYLAYRQMFERDPKHGDLATFEGQLATMLKNYSRITPKYMRNKYSVPKDLANERADIAKRRILWMAQGLLLYRAELLAEKDPSLIPPLARAWSYIVANSHALYGSLKQNILWSDDELGWFGEEGDKFSFIKEPRGALLALEMTVPKVIAKSTVYGGYAPGFRR